MSDAVISHRQFSMAGAKAGGAVARKLGLGPKKVAIASRIGGYVARKAAPVVAAAIKKEVGMKMGGKVRRRRAAKK